jgi:hypothetical protein
MKNLCYTFTMPDGRGYAIPLRVLGRMKAISQSVDGHATPDEIDRATTSLVDRWDALKFVASNVPWENVRGHAYVVREHLLPTEAEMAAGFTAGRGFDVTDQPFRFRAVQCSQCGGEFGPGNHGYSHCDDHLHLFPVAA